MPFTSTQFFEVFQRYNEAVGLLPALLAALALVAVALVVAGRAANGRWVAAVLATLWLWAGIAYHLAFFSAVNPAAVVFGALFIVEGGLLAWEAVRRPCNFRFHATARGIAAGIVVAYGLVVYPLVGLASGQRYPTMPTFGVPCPVTIFTFGMLLWWERRVPVRLWVIPAAWSLIGGWAALSLGVVEDYGLLITGVVGTALLMAPAITGRRMVDSRRGAAGGTPRPASTSGARPH